MFIHNVRAGRRLLSGGMALLMLCSPLGGLVAPAHAADASTYNTSATAPSILLFPFANNAGTTAAAIGPELDDAVKLRLNAINAYTIIAYTKFLPSVQRATLDNVLSSDDLSRAGSDPQVSGKIAAQADTDDYLTGAVESFTADPATRRVKLEVSADLRSTQTGASLRTVAFTGEAGPLTNSDTLQSVTQVAINTVASKIVASVHNGLPSHTIMASSQRGHSSAGQKFLIGVLATSLLIAILSNTHNGGSSSSSSSGTTTSTGTGTGTTGMPGVPAPPTP